MATSGKEQRSRREKSRSVLFASTPFFSPSSRALEIVFSAQAKRYGPGRQLEEGAIMVAAEDGAGSKPTRGAETPELASGERLNGRFLVEALAASGGMGSVYRARDLSSGELVALRVPAPRA